MVITYKPYSKPEITKLPLGKRVTHTPEKSYRTKHFKLDIHGVALSHAYLESGALKEWKEIMKCHYMDF
jgi:hypothetical protein